jgi:hypothetical protein
MGGHVAWMEEKRNAYKGFEGKKKKKDHYEEIGIGGTIILKRIFREIESGIMDWINLS